TPLYVFLFPSSRLAPRSTLFPYTTLFRSAVHLHGAAAQPEEPGAEGGLPPGIRFTGHRLDEAKRPGAGRPDQPRADDRRLGRLRSEEHTSELQSRENLVCRLLLEKKNTMI